MNKKHLLVALSFALTGLFSCSKDSLNETATVDQAISATSTKQTLKRAGNFYFGVNGQPLSSVYPYNKVSASEQVNLVKSMDMNIYRFGAAFQVNTGESTVPYLYRPLREAAQKGNVTLLPHFDIRTLNYDHSLAENYNDARSFGIKISLAHRNDFDYYEIGNELDNRCIIRGGGNAGDKISHYDPKKISRIVAAVKGMIDGIKYSDPDAKCIVNCSWMHYAFMDRLLRSGARIDIIGWHWYSDMEGAAKKTYGIDDITQFLSNRYDKPIWFTEFNLKDSYGRPLDEKEQQEFIESFTAKCRNNPQVQAAIVWELFDQPNRSASERNYGIIKFVTNTANNLLPKVFAKTTSNLL